MEYKIHSQELREEQYEIVFDLLEKKKVVLGPLPYKVGKTKLAQNALNDLMVKEIIPTFKLIQKQQKKYSQPGI